MADIKASSSNEEEYFHKQEQERLEARRAEAAIAKAAADREALTQLHHMHCPKCGATLTTETYHRVQVDRCGGNDQAGRAFALDKPCAHPVCRLLDCLISHLALAE